MFSKLTVRMTKKNIKNKMKCNNLYKNKINYFSFKILAQTDKIWNQLIHKS